jgi:hypothetical protein
MQHYNTQFKVKSSSYTLDYHSLPQEQFLQDFRGLSFLSLKWQSNVLHESTNLKQHLSINTKQRPGSLGKENSWKAECPYIQFPRKEKYLTSESAIRMDMSISIWDDPQLHNVNEPIVEEWVEIIDDEICTIWAQGF